MAKIIFTLKCLRFLEKKFMLLSILCIEVLKVVYLLIFLDDHGYSDAYMLQAQR